MILIDVGNTNIVFAVSNNNKIKKISRIGTNKEINKFVKNVDKIIKNALSENISISKVVNKDNRLLIAVTEKRTREQIDNLVLFLKKQ